MPSSIFERPATDLPLAAEYPAYEGRLPLVCKTCGDERSYQVGRIFVDPARFRRGMKPELLDDAISFTAYLQCARCDALGPWGLTRRARIWLIGRLRRRRDDQPAVVHYGAVQLFDGTLARSGGESEAYLKRLIEQHPDDYFLWSRLGNLYCCVGHGQQAISAFATAIRLNPQDVESHHSLGCELLEQGRIKEGAEHLRQVLRHARHYTRRTKWLLRDIVRDSLERLFELFQQSNGEFAVFPEPDCEETAESRGPVVVHLAQIDLSTDEAWEDLTTSIISGKPPTPRRSQVPCQAPEGPIVEQRARIGRNDRCPCGSGKKFKRCCG